MDGGGAQGTRTGGAWGHYGWSCSALALCGRLGENFKLILNYSNTICRPIMINII